MWIEGNPFTEMRVPESQNHSRSTSTHSNDRRQLKGMKKRPRMESDTASPEPETQIVDSASKRKRGDRILPSGDDDVRDAMPVSMETEDISEEVNRRLKIKEERRKKKDSKSEKRKRESLTSNESASPRERQVKPRAKRLRVKYTLGGQADASEANDHHAGHGAKRQGSGNTNFEARKGVKKPKKEPQASTTV